MSANSLGDVNELSPFRFWCQRVLPLVYDDNLSDYELLCKVVDYINKLITDEQQLVTTYDEIAGIRVEVGDLKADLTYKADKVYGGDTTATYYNAAGGKSWTDGGLYVNVSNRAASDPIRYTPDMKSVDVTPGYRVAVFGNNEGAGHPITLFGNWFLPSNSLSNYPYDYIFAIIRSEPEGDITTDLSDVLSISKYDAAYEFALKKDLDETDENLTDSEDGIKLRCDISGTIQTPVYDSEGQLIKIEHTSDGSVVRTDEFTYSGNVITETRTLSNGKTLAYIYYLETNIVEVN